MATMQPAGTVPALDLRITIEETEPLVWRRLVVPLSLTFSEFHLALQSAFGWEDRHLYSFRAADVNGKPRLIVGPDEEAEDLGAEPASGVVLTDLFDAWTSDALIEYEYDLGDAWTHEIQVIGPGELAAGELLCLEGANRGPVEDSGGPHGYRRLVQILGDRTHPEYRDAASWVYAMTGQFNPHLDPAVFDLAAANRKLRLLCLQWWPCAVTDDERDSVLGPVRWLLDNAAGDGLELTKDGYLKPATVQRALEELGLADMTVGKGNREANVTPVRELRQHLIDWKLLRKFKGRLLLTACGKRGLDRPADLWDYVVEAIAVPQHDAVRLVTRLYMEWLLSGIAPPSNRRVEVIRNALESTGFVTRSGHRIPEQWASEINQTVRWNLKVLNLMVPKQKYSDRSLLTDGGVKFLLEAREVERLSESRWSG